MLVHFCLRVERRVAARIAAGVPPNTAVGAGSVRRGPDLLEDLGRRVDVCRHAPEGSHECAQEAIGSHIGSLTFQNESETSSLK